MKKQIINAIVAFLLILMPVVAKATIGTSVGNGAICPATEADIPISVTNCNGISAISLALSYDSDKVTYLGYQNPNAQLGSILHVNAAGGVVYLTWYSLNAVDFGDANLIELRFEGINGTTSLTWNTAECEYSDANGNAIQSTYSDGSITVYDLPAITSQPNSVTITEGQNTTFAVTATGSGLGYQWQVSINGGTTWSDLSNTTPYNNVTTRQMNITNAPLILDGNLYRCKVTGNCDPEAYSDAVLLTVYDLLPTINTTAGTASSCPETTFGIPVSVTNCNNVGAISLALSYNTSLVTYSGYENVHTNLSSGMMEINEENGVVYFTWVASGSPLTIGDVILFELKFESQSGNSSFTWNTVDCEYSTPTGRVFPTSFTSGSATVYAVPSITSQPVNHTIDEGTNTTFGISATGHGLSYQWQVSTDGGEQWNNVSSGTHYSNVTTATLNVLSATTDMDGYCYRCKVTGTCDPAAYSNAGLLHVNPLLPTITTQLVSTSSCQDVEFEADVMVSNFENVGSVSLALSYDTLLLTFEGYDNLNTALADGSLFVNAANGVVYVSWMSIAGASIGNGRLLSVKFVGNPGNIALNWYTSRCEYANIIGLVFPATYQDGTATVYSAPYINSHPSHRTIYEGSNTSFSVNAGGQTLSYQWQVSEDEGETWTNLSSDAHYNNTTSATLNINNATLDMNGLCYRCVVTGECEPETISDSAKLTVNHLLPTITTTAGSMTTCSSTEFSIPVTVTNFNGVGAVSLALAYDADILTYVGFEGVNPILNNGEIHVNADGGVVYVTWMSVAGANIGNGTLLWIKFTSNEGNSSLNWDIELCEYSDLLGAIFPATYTNGSVTVQQVDFTIDTQPEDQTILEGETATFSITTTGTGLSFQWQVSEDEGSSWDDLTANEVYADVNTSNLTINGTTWSMNGNRYRCSVTGSCGMQYSHSALLIVDSLYEFYEVTAMVSPENAGAVTGAGTYLYGATCTLTATANEGYTFVYWTKDGEVVSTEAIYSFTVTEDASYVANFITSQGEVTQETAFAQGWNWWSTYIEQGGINGLELLENSLGDNGITIRSQASGYNDYYAGYGWYGSLASINNESSYRVITSTPCIVTMTGNVAVPSLHPITLSHGWTWMGYVPSTAMDVNEALSGLEATEGDKLKSQQGYADYYVGYGWYGSLNTIEPGMGLMYYSTNGNPISFTYPDNGRGGELRQNLTAENNHWVPNVYAYPDNMTVMAVVELDNVELSSDNYELAAFTANSECRGSVRLTYAEPLHRHVAFLTISGKDAAELSFRLYDTETGMEYYDAEESLDFVADAIVGDADDLYIIHFRGTTGMDELASKVQVYPNPVNVGERFSINVADDVKNPVRVEIVNALGVETLRATSVQLPAQLTAPATAGVYTLRITVEGKGTVVRKLVVK